MKVILMSELPGKGGEGDVITVADGYANNWLFPQKIAIPATKGNLKQLEQRRNNIAKREVARVADANALKETLEGKSVRVIATVGDEGVLYGSVTGAQIADAIKAQLGSEVDRRRIDLRQAIKTVGVHPVTVQLYREISAVVNVEVNDEAGFAAEDQASTTEAQADEAPAEQPAEDAE
ncbi:MAG: 50S ribosomal protein L9 [Coriobacteriales bacterium]|jgi:large subunit ribosomal protein L9